MEKGSILHGFEVIKKSAAPDIDAALFELRHIKSGARVLFIDRDDSNMTLSVAFKTHPEDSSGVFHIIEHTVLSGSEKYPLKDAYTALARGSLKTFLNAYTYPDKTVYPISSRCMPDLLNLAEVYLDGIFHPLFLRNEAIFLTEGYRAELDEAGAVRHGGVVYNEMKGAYASAADLAARHMSRLLFPEGIYSLDSGGDPAEIPNLTYDEFCRVYRRHYHPKNSYTVIDGSVDLSALLSLLDGYFSEYGSDFTLPSEAITLGEVDTERTTVYFPREAEGGDGRLSIGWRATRFDECERAYALLVAADAVAGSTDAPLKKKILDTGLCTSFSLSFSSGDYMGSLVATFNGVREGEVERLVSEFDASLATVLSEELSREALSAALNSLEFSVREGDYGSYPRGAAYASSVYESWLFGGDPALNLSYSEHLHSLREKIGTDFFLNLLREIMTGPRAQLVLMPRERVESAPPRFPDEGERGDILRRLALFEAWQAEPESEEAVAKIPRISLSDIDPEPRTTPTECREALGVPLLLHPIATSGITYINLYFDASDVSRRELYLLTVLTRLFDRVPTESGPQIRIRNKIKESLGSLSVSLIPTRNEGGVRLYIQVSASVLDGKRQLLPELLREYLLTSRLDDVESVTRRIAVMNTALNDLTVNAGHSLADTHAAAMQSELSALREELYGFSMTRKIRAAHRAGEEKIEKIAKRLSALRDKIFTRRRLIISETGKSDLALAERIASLFPEGRRAHAMKIEPLPARRVGFLAPVGVGYAAVSMTVPNVSPKTDGLLAVLEQMVNYDILWEKIRQGIGAYDASLTHRILSQTLSAYTYRDPSPSESAEIILSLPRLIEEYLESEPEFEEFIIGTIGELEGLTTPSTDGATADLHFLAGKTDGELRLMREAILSFDGGALREAADLIGEAAVGATLALVADRKTLEKSGVEKIYRV